MPQFAGKGHGRLMRLRRIDLGSGKTTTVREIELMAGQAPSGLAAHRRRVAWIVAGRTRDTISILDTRSGATTTVRSGHEGGFGYPEITSRFVCWAESSGNSPADVGGYLYDFAAAKLYSLGNTSGLYGVHCNGNTVTWQGSESGARLEDIVNVVGRLR